MSRQKAIDAKCKDCIYDPLAGGTWRMQTTRCQATDCPLWEHRPVDDKEKTIRRQARIDAMSPVEREAYEAKRRISLDRFLKVGIKPREPRAS